MRTLVVLICGLALACVAGAQPPPEKKGQPKKRGVPAGQVSQPHGRAVGKPAGAGKPMTTGKPTTTGKPMEVGKPTGVAKGKATGKPAEVGKPAKVSKAKGPGKPETTTGTAAQVGKPAKAPKPPAGPKPEKAAVAAGKPLKPQHFKLPKEPNTAKAPPVKFQQGRHIEGSEHWQGQQYAVFRNYHSEWHDQGWWHNHYHNNITFVFGAPYYFNAGYWFPAWGYYPNAYYAWDGPIYAYHRLPPDQVIANVQSTLQQQGYYHGDVDGLVGPLTRAALADYQRDHGLYETAAIDRPTLESLGMS
jgi:Putative peptidoglycan binding domain